MRRPRRPGRPKKPATRVPVAGPFVIREIWPGDRVDYLSEKDGRPAQFASMQSARARKEIVEQEAPGITFEVVPYSALLQAARRRERERLQDRKRKQR